MPTRNKPPQTFYLQWRDAIRKSKLRACIKTVLHELGFHSDPDGQHVSASQQRIAEHTGLDRSTVNQMIGEAIEAGYLEIIEPGRQGRSNVYRLRLPDASKPS
jgi:DNA-binding MarR family transcriptional regulator